MSERAGPESSWLLRLAPSAVPPEPACPPETLAMAELPLGPGPVGWAVEVARDMAAHIVRQVPEHGTPGAYPLFQRAVEATVLTAVRGLATEPEPNASLVASHAVAGIAELARRNVPLDRVLRGVRLGHAYLHARLMEALDKEPEDIRAQEVHRISELLFVYADVQSSRLAEEYVAERDRWRRSTEAARRRTVDDLLTGRSIGAAVAARTLGYELARHHTAFIVTSRSQDTSADELRQLAAELCRAAGGESLLTVTAGATELWAWACWPAEPSRDALAALPALVPERRPLRAAIGPVGYGVEGFRRSHRGAREAERVARLGRTGWLCDYTDVSTAALLTADTEHARWFAARVLGALGADDPRVRELRETLRVYLAEGRSPQGAAELLFVARNTVTYRVRRALELLGRPLEQDALELRMALEIARLLG
ncbi:helix-turn-helix domain-containing protein [Streptomyces cinnabarinus]|uniref:Helix-turn-helix domain-containing protein n=1 Tax=Streptomyces cinnabarinus TaxID=67287 RepID=A0ABY7KAF6_9ACTN|nr:helix-turn-helix domain-containing protein [Streptomyces cinnabarinus]WAZ21512.1 helix-turn-helix domain-containing protein [Streptomyces cinnabarinus]